MKIILMMMHLVERMAKLQMERLRLQMERLQVERLRMVRLQKGKDQEGKTAVLAVGAKVVTEKKKVMQAQAYIHTVRIWIISFSKGQYYKARASCATVNSFGGVLAIFPQMCVTCG
jgi:hypothetical protein